MLALPVVNRKHWSKSYASGFNIIACGRVGKELGDYILMTTVSK